MLLDTILFMKILQSPRLILRNTLLEDSLFLYEEIFNVDEVTQFTFGKELNNFEQCEEFIKKQCNFDAVLGLSTLVEKQTDKIIGLAGVIECDYLGTQDYEFGFILGKSFWSKGYATEIGEAQIKYVKEVLKAKRVLALVHKDNTASVKCIKKLGLQYEKSVTTINRGSRDVYILEF